MILPDDFQIEVGETERGAFVRVRHAPTGKQRLVDPLPRGERVERVRDRLIREIKGEFYSDHDVRMDIGHGEEGDFLRVIHLPSGKTRMIYPIGRQNAVNLQTILLDEIIEELVCEKNRKS